MSAPIALQEGWQGGPASIELEVDEVQLDDGSVGDGVIIRINTPTDGGEGGLELGTGRLDFPAGKGQLEFWVLASIDQAREVRDAFTEAIDGRDSP